MTPEDTKDIKKLVDAIIETDHRGPGEVSKWAQGIDLFATARRVRNLLMAPEKREEIPKDVDAEIVRI